MANGGNSRATPPQVLVVADEPRDREQIARMVGSDFSVDAVAPGELAERSRFVDTAAAVAVLEGPRVAECVAALLPLRELPSCRALVLLPAGVSEAKTESAIRRLGASLVLPKPPGAAALQLALRRVLSNGVQGAGARLQHRTAPGMLGVSAAIRDVMESVRRIAPTRMPVLILGETGTGKELVARAIHEESPWPDAPFVAINCSALPESLLEAELFGSKRGAYTGSDRDRCGLFEQADGGTLFLDEIGDTSPALQAKLLRAIEEQEVRPLGTSEVRRVDVRVVSATHQDLEAMVKEGEFRRDLYYRINTATIHVPPLRRRRVDIPFLAQHFAEEFGEAHARRIVLDEGFLEALARHDFPGNVRELRNAVERAMALARADEPVTARYLHLSNFQTPEQGFVEGTSLRERVDELECRLICEALQRYDGNRTHAAQALGLTRQGLRYKMRRFGLA